MAKGKSTDVDSIVNTGVDIDNDDDMKRYIEVFKQNEGLPLTTKTGKFVGMKVHNLLHYPASVSLPFLIRQCCRNVSDVSIKTREHLIGISFGLSDYCFYWTIPLDENGVPIRIDDLDIEDDDRIVSMVDNYSSSDDLLPPESRAILSKPTVDMANDVLSIRPDKAEDVSELKKVVGIIHDTSSKQEIREMAINEWNWRVNILTPAIKSKIPGDLLKFLDNSLGRLTAFSVLDKNNMRASFIEDTDGKRILKYSKLAGSSNDELSDISADVMDASVKDTSEVASSANDIMVIAGDIV
jgi:hypothetical protein